MVDEPNCIIIELYFYTSSSGLIHTISFMRLSNAKDKVTLICENLNLSSVLCWHAIATLISPNIAHTDAISLLCYFAAPEPPRLTDGPSTWCHCWLKNPEYLRVLSHTLRHENGGCLVYHHRCLIFHETYEVIKTLIRLLGWKLMSFHGSQTKRHTLFH